MGKVINLRTAKKQLKRNEKEKTAEQNRAKFGRTSTEKNIIQAKQKAATKFLDGKKITSIKPDKPDDLV